MAAILGLLQVGWGFVKTYRIWITAIALVSFMTSVFVFYGNCKENKVKLDYAEVQIEQLQLDLTAARKELQLRNSRIQKMNEDRVKERMEAEAALDTALKSAKKLQIERDAARKELEQTRFELVEAIQNDEELADWVNEPVPASAWSLLQSAAQGSASTGMHSNN